ncbi:hypothetical protein AB0M89_12765 [Streptomyces microflavus]|uniref:hypothetical protein n=1 Tax=Streptomyces microflavus TaxID=1919 RepID=UPI00342FB3C8
MNDFGISETNDPRVRVLWEREGKTVRLGLAVDPPPRTLVASLPPTARSEESP